MTRPLENESDLPSIQDAGTEPEFLLESGAILVVNKPGGLLTQAPPGIDSLETRVRRALAHREGGEGDRYLAVLHRLDRPAAGALLMARNLRIAKKLSRQFEERSVRKLYWAIVEGSPPTSEGRWVDNLRKVPGEARSEIAAADAPGAQYAALRFRVLRQTEGKSLLEIDLETGRTHQIRVQAAVRGMPILGDSQYGSQHAYGPQTGDLRLRWIALWARELTFCDPGSGALRTVIAPTPAHWTPAFAPES